MRVLLQDVDTNPQDKVSLSAKEPNNTTLTDGKGAVTQDTQSQTGHVETQMTETTMAKKAVTFEVTTSPLVQPIKLSPKEWQALHDEWLNSTMRAEMEDEALQGIPTMTGYCEGKRSTMANKKIVVVPTQGFVVRYDLWIKATAGDNPVESSREAMVVWFTKIKEIDKNAIIYPWKVEDRKIKEKCLEKPSDIPFLLSNMKKYLNKLYI